VAVEEMADAEDNVQDENSTTADMKTKLIVLLGLIGAVTLLALYFSKVDKQWRMKSMPKEAHEDTQQQNDNA
jgi:low temperature requirement protein LtrA